MDGEQKERLGSIVYLHDAPKTKRIWKMVTLMEVEATDEREAVAIVRQKLRDGIWRIADHLPIYARGSRPVPVLNFDQPTEAERKVRK